MEPNVRQGLAKEGRVWLLAVVCAVPGALAASRFDSWWAGAGVFLAFLAVLGPLLFLYERRRRGGTGRTRTEPPAARDTPSKRSVNQTYGQQKRRRQGR